MNNKSYMSISEFGRITGIKRANLIFYDKAGLLSPEFRGENEYRYYTRQQLGSAYLITALRELGIGLNEIRAYAQDRTPEKMLVLLAEQKKSIQKEISRLKRMNDMMNLYTHMAQEGIHCNTEEIVLQEREKEPIFLGPAANPAQTDDENSILFYRYAMEQGMESGYPMGCIISKDLLENRVPEDSYICSVSNYYFKVKKGATAYKPKGLYAVTHGLCGYGESAFLYNRLLTFIRQQGLQLCGDAYEEYLLNEMAVQDDSKYCTQISMLVSY